MGSKSTAKLEEELKLYPNYVSFYEENRTTVSNGALSDLLNELLRKKGLKKSDVICASNLNEVYGYQIFRGERLPDRTKLLGLVFGMGLDFEETQQLLKSAGYAPLYATRSLDCIVIYALMHKMTLFQANDLLYRYEETLIG